MKYKVGDRVRIKSLDWYNENKNNRNEITFENNPHWRFVAKQSDYCGQIATITSVSKTAYRLGLIPWNWTDEMIEGLVEEASKPKFKVGDKITNGKGTVTILTLTSDSYILEDTFGECGTLYFKYQDRWKIVEEEVGLVDKLSSRWVNEFNLPKGYIFKDENGNVINAQKIVLEKKKKEYPTFKNLGECKEILGEKDMYQGVSGYKGTLLTIFQKLLIFRDAYWKIAGEEMGLGKPWEPDWEYDDTKYVLFFNKNEICRDMMKYTSYVLAFPTEEMRDAFYENFKSEIESVKELL